MGTSRTVLCVRRRGRLVAAARARSAGDDSEICRLMVVPDLSGRGIGRWLLRSIEELAPANLTRFTLFIGGKSIRKWWRVTARVAR
jgi:tRNA (guanine37-N1)-methyltransferase